MKRRSKAGGEPIKGRRRKTPEPERRSAPKRVSSSTPSATLGLEKGILQNAPFAPYKYRRRVTAITTRLCNVLLCATSQSMRAICANLQNFGIAIRAESHRRLGVFIADVRPVFGFCETGNWLHGSCSPRS